MKREVIGYVMGFIDAEGSFSVSIKLQRDMAYGVRLDPVFSITQRERRPLEIIASVVRAGRIIRKPGQGHLWLYVVDNMNELINNLIPFIDSHRDLLIAKEKIYGIFREIVLGLNNKLHRRLEGLKKLIFLSYELSNLSSKARRRRAIKQVIKVIESRATKRGEPPGDR